MEKFYKIAGLNIKMDVFDMMEWRASVYEVNHVNNVDMEINADWQAIKRKYPEASNGLCLYTASGKEFYQNLIDFDGMLLHSSAVCVNGKAYLFSANPGTGKSTHTTLWRRVLGDEKVRIMNDDKPALRFEDGVWYAYGTPWSGKTTQNLNLRYPVGGIAFLERGEINRIERYKGSDLIFKFLNQTSRSVQRERQTKLLDYISSIISEIPVWRLGCNMEPEAAIVAYEAMTGEKYK